ncbi:hypothetical protein EDB80DRAFT_684167 [Ilyonectria destructans]|nr:hypothetical protein EDB80DRAFT_684167 [Ilyonectria destructans]
MLSLKIYSHLLVVSAAIGCLCQPANLKHFQPIDVFPFSPVTGAGGVKKALSFSPWHGSFIFSYKDIFLSYRTSLRDVGFHKKEEISMDWTTQLAHLEFEPKTQSAIEHL